MTLGLLILIQYDEQTKKIDKHMSEILNEAKFSICLTESRSSTFNVLYPFFFYFSFVQVRICTCLIKYINFKLVYVYFIKPVPLQTRSRLVFP